MAYRQAFAGDWELLTLRLAARPYGFRRMAMPLTDRRKAWGDSHATCGSARLQPVLKPLDHGAFYP